MQTAGIKALETNPGLLGQTLDRGEYLLITRCGKPIGIAAPFDDELLDQKDQHLNQNCHP